jgi:predicted TIM-barrel fold metal-dependent hydrolase
MRAGLLAFLCLVVLAACKGQPPPPPVPPPAPWQRPPVIDFHGHLSLDGQERIAQILTENGIERMINLSGGNSRRGGAQWQEAKQLADRFGGRIINFATPDWRGFGQAGWAEKEAAALAQAVNQFGFAGLKISKALGLGATDETDQLIAPDDPRVGPLWAKAADLGIPVAIHIADPRAFWLPLTPENERWDELQAHPYWAYGPMPPALASQVPPRPPMLSWEALLQASERLYRQNPRTTFVAVHMGNCAEDLDWVSGLLARNPNVHVDLAARFGEFGRHPPDKVRAFFAQWQDRIVFGTDIGIGSDFLMLGSNGAVEPTIVDVKPFYDAHWRYLEGSERQIAHPSPIQGNWRIDAVGLAPAILDKVYRGNALKLLDRKHLVAFAASAGPPRATGDEPPPASDPKPPRATWLDHPQAVTPTAAPVAPLADPHDHGH